MKKKIIVVMSTLILLAVITFLILNHLDIFTTQDLKDISISRAKDIPVLENYLVTMDENNRLENEVIELQNYLEKIQDQNEELLREVEIKNRQVLEYQDTLEALEGDLSQVLTDREDYETKVSRLSQVYREMDEERAASILTELEMDLAIDILARMRERDVANILEAMETDVAARISTRLSN
ncbi:MotE family protein [Halonatronum saccharophilum]|uniref:MotE family protein n=1 Tax=Halonatronum saccharophilum TaxID=150060 RepID=UPI000487BFEC|nr:hypothetical protein [Halonatronum saccharophilum]